MNNKIGEHNVYHNKHSLFMEIFYSRKPLCSELFQKPRQDKCFSIVYVLHYFYNGSMFYTVVCLLLFKNFDF